MGDVPVGIDFIIEERKDCYLCHCESDVYGPLKKRSSCMMEYCQPLSSTCEKSVRPPGTCCPICEVDKHHGVEHWTFPPIPDFPTFPPIQFHDEKEETTK